MLTDARYDKFTVLTKHGHNDIKPDMINIQHKLVVIVHLPHE